VPGLIVGLDPDEGVDPEVVDAEVVGPVDEGRVVVGIGSLADVLAWRLTPGKGAVSGDGMWFTKRSRNDVEMAEPLVDCTPAGSVSGIGL
jgi:hypothetical protein